MQVNPKLRPISEAKPGQHVIAYSRDGSPMCAAGKDYSVTAGYIGTGSTPGLWTEKFGFFANFSELGVTWTHFVPVPEFEVPE